MNKKINLGKVRKERNRIPKEERDELIKPKGDEISNKTRVNIEKVEKENINENLDNKNTSQRNIVVEETIEETRLMKLIEKLPKQDKFIKNGIRQQSSINTSDYTSCLIDILVEAKLNEGEKIRKTSYLEKYLVQGLKKELKELGIDIK